MADTEARGMPRTSDELAALLDVTVCARQRSAVRKLLVVCDVIEAIRPVGARRSEHHERRDRERKTSALHCTHQ
jgi:hypothetical protein